MPDRLHDRPVVRKRHAFLSGLGIAVGFVVGILLLRAVVNGGALTGPDFAVLLLVWVATSIAWEVAVRWLVARRTAT